MGGSGHFTKGVIQLDTLQVDPKGKVVVVEGEQVIYADEKGVRHNALVTAVWEGEFGSAFPGLNLVVVDQDQNKHDQYGRQIRRESSVPHKMDQKAHGKYWVEK